MSRYVLITGGELQNKGAQAMTFITVSEVKKRFPDRKIVLLSTVDYKRTAEEKDNYAFDILPFPSNLFVLQSKTLTALYLSCKKATAVFQKFCNVLENTDAIIDVSGYTFGSNWGTRHSFYFLLRFGMAKTRKIPFYLMPQSFGPFDFKGKHAPIIKYMCKHTLSKAKVICARETDGKIGLEKNYGLKNVVLSPDLVLQSKGIDLKAVYKALPQQYNIDIPGNSVALIPNAKNIKYSNDSFAIGIYERLIDSLLTNHKNVFLVYHAIEDGSICKRLKASYRDNESVRFIDRELSCIEFESLVEKFQFVIASRYHSIVHSYKKSVPAIIIGWAVKYKELSEKFHQEIFCFDINGCNDFTDIENKVYYMCNSFEDESKKIESGLAEIQKNNVYDYINLQENNK